MIRNIQIVFYLLFSFFLLNVLVGCEQTRNKPLKADYSNFKLSDTLAIDSIVLQDKGGRKVQLVRMPTSWKVNDDFEARPDLIGLMLNTLHRMEVKEFVRKSAIDNLLRQLAVFSTRVKVYEKGVLLRDFHVGGPTLDHYGTYMLLSGADVPVVVYVPGFRGYLSNHFSPLLTEWKDRKVFHYHIQDLQSVKVIHHREPESSFIVNVNSPEDFTVMHLSSGKALTDLDTGLLKIFLKNFKVLGFESFAELPKEKMDSIVNHYALYSISVTDLTGKTKTLELYEIPLPPGTISMLGEPVSVDLDRMYGIIDGEYLTLCQYFTYDPVTVPIRWFIPGMASTVSPGKSGSRFHD
jgi:hypothetical protein